ncbi:hypothetical protein RU639_013835, partial [Aspergillus parasiticus]
MDRVSNVACGFQRNLKELHTLYHGVGFQYLPLQGSSDIRLLRIHPGRPSDGISCSIRVVGLDENPKCTALSYTWRKQHSTWQASALMAFETMKSMYQGNLYDMHVPESERKERSPKAILCNGRKINISLNLYDALVSLRDIQSRCWYWIDALCINQSDTEEKILQISKMGRKYQSAELVLVWLGDCSSKIARGLPSLETLAKKMQSELP